jgi:outer membrane immunogenic protein
VAQSGTDAAITGGYYDSERTAATGALFGGQVGYNWQAHNIVYGLEADLNWVGAHGSETKIPYFLPISYETKLTWLATVRARAGMAFGRTLLYGTGGLAVGGVDNSWIFIGCPCSLVENRETRVGWTAGGGIEHVIASNLTAKAEVLYVDLGRGNATDIFGDYISRFKNTAVVGRLGVNLKW